MCKRIYNDARTNYSDSTQGFNLFNYKLLIIVIYLLIPIVSNGQENYKTTITPTFDQIGQLCQNSVIVVP